MVRAYTALKQLHDDKATYAAIQKRSPVGNKYTAGLDAELATFLQTVAADTVREYFGRDRG